ncbi:uncharacterized protein SPPG_03707 [Spizellomyces punctatus DAOM BR117]|uniref:Transmembrane protein n=1 Tax=Spizellomyces punctatus (strain DAOM BR117) TaxID=645134 RepID=A0A0L0HHN3_SPIPD|nr:uncharacterized protein SPPG_03707 [Spizellomyces punctatus DAOM BR117]KND00583.1 hypothetical protein SPPG_03707 [Spizellomyces punctatus DAOM BR117]|eukprot:XP_016608622.1 hypothetical protein SPPG_03707 [Spizellomyces punctatus DAOM BR117]
MSSVSIGGLGHWPVWAVVLSLLILLLCCGTFAFLLYRSRAGTSKPSGCLSFWEREARLDIEAADSKHEILHVHNVGATPGPEKLLFSKPSLRAMALLKKSSREEIGKHPNGWDKSDEQPGTDDAARSSDTFFSLACPGSHQSWSLPVSCDSNPFLQYAQALGSGIADVKRLSLVPMSSVIHVEESPLVQEAEAQLIDQNRGGDDGTRSNNVSRQGSNLKRQKRSLKKSATERRGKLVEDNNGQVPTLKRSGTLSRSATHRRAPQDNIALRNGPSSDEPAQVRSNDSSNQQEIRELDADRELSDGHGKAKRRASAPTRNSRSGRKKLVKSTVTDKVRRSCTVSGNVRPTGNAERQQFSVASGTESSGDDTPLDDKSRRGFIIDGCAKRAPARLQKAERPSDFEGNEQGIHDGKLSNFSQCSLTVDTRNLHESDLGDRPSASHISTHGRSEHACSAGLHRTQSTLYLGERAKIERQNAVRFLARSSSYRVMKMQERHESSSQAENESWTAILEEYTQAWASSSTAVEQTTDRFGER